MHNVKPDGRGQGMRVCADCGETEPEDSTQCPAAPLPVADARCTMTHWHSEKSCADDDVYRMVGSCANCRSQVIGVFTKGHEARSGWNSPVCPVCGCDGHLHWKSLGSPKPGVS